MILVYDSLGVLPVRLVQYLLGFPVLQWILWNHPLHRYHLDQRLLAIHALLVIPDLPGRHGNLIALGFRFVRRDREVPLHQ